MKIVVWLMAVLLIVGLGAFAAWYKTGGDWQKAGALVKTIAAGNALAGSGKSDGEALPSVALKDEVLQEALGRLSEFGLTSQKEKDIADVSRSARELAAMGLPTDDGELLAVHAGARKLKGSDYLQKNPAIRSLLTDASEPMSERTKRLYDWAIVPHLDALFLDDALLDCEIEDAEDGDAQCIDPRQISP